MNLPRALHNAEKALITALLARKPEALRLVESLSAYRVEEMNDGGMGSLRFCARDGQPRCLGDRLVEAEFLDSDGVPIMVAINLDDRGELYELDVWKVDFSPLIRFPSVIG